ncbi:MAG: c-type cytochrome [Paracoccaceae bacterium]
MKLKLTLLALLATTAPAFAAGDAAKGEAVFKQCQTCHIVADADGNVLAGKASKTGPNLYGVVGRAAGSIADFKYGDDMLAAGAAGLVWDEEKLVAYVQNPSAFLKETLNDKGAKGKMQFQVKDPVKAADVVAYIASLAPAAAPAATDPAAAPATEAPKTP